MGSRFAAMEIARRFCGFTLLQMKSDNTLTAGDLIEAARRTQVSLDELAQSLLTDPGSQLFKIVCGSKITPPAAVRLLENTLNPKLKSMPSALNATLIGGVVEPATDLTSYRVELLRIGDGVAEHIDGNGKITALLATEPDVMKISESLGPGPRSRVLFERPPDEFTSKSVVLRAGEFLVISSDGLVRGHRQLVSEKLAELLGQDVLNAMRPDEADAALQVLQKACLSADELFKRDGTQRLFGDNVSLIIIRPETDGLSV
jgi:hypothetical protein